MSAQMPDSRLIREVDIETGEQFSERLGLHPDYVPVVMEPVSGYGPIIDAWVGMKYPLNVDEDGEHGVITGRGMRHARQHPDGSGTYESVAGGTLYAIRTADGTVIWNAHADDDHWPYKASATDAIDREVSVPFGFVGAVVTEQTDADLYHPDSILAMGTDGNLVEGEEFMRGVVSADLCGERGDDYGVLLEHEDGIQVYVGFDATAHGEGTFAFVPFDGHEGVRVPAARDALDLLRPDEALAAETRQGEWYLVPIDDADEFEGTIQKPGVNERPYGPSPLENHVPRDWKTRADDGTFVRRVAQAVGEDMTGDDPLVSWQDTPADVFDKIRLGRLGRELTHEEARELAGGVAVRGSVRHRRGEHRMETLDDWHQAVTHDREVISIDDQTQNYHMD